MTRSRVLSIALFLLASAGAEARWPEAKAKDWYARQPWLVGANYNPASAINQLEMWQADTFNPAEIDKELGWAEGLGMNTMRVFLHDLLWQQDPAGFRKRLDTFLQISAKHGIRPMFVLFDSVWDPDPVSGRQPAPKPGIHNSGWMQSPGAKALRDTSEHPRLQAYVKGVVGAFKNDKRVLAWDVWNEPDNTNGPKFGAREPADKIKLVETLLPKVFEWARAANPSQPLTSGVWHGKDWGVPANLSPIMKTQLDESDVISFHSYDKPEVFEQRVQSLRKHGRPLLCTEYMARGNNSTFQGILPIGARLGIAMYNWGFVKGKTQTDLPWDSWEKPYVGGREPTTWFHEIFRPDGKPYDEKETELIRQLTRDTRAKRKAA